MRGTDKVPLNVALREDDGKTVSILASSRSFCQAPFIATAQLLHFELPSNTPTIATPTFPDCRVVGRVQ